MSHSALGGPIRGLYGMVDLRPGDPPAGRLAGALLDGGAQILQLRMKQASASAMLAVVDELRPLCRRRGARLVVNDRLDVALAGGADGVHLGQEDLPLAAARQVAAAGPPGFLIGVSTHDLAQVEAALAGGADYLGFGPVFPTGTKEHPDPVVGVAALAAVCRRAPVPVVAIGGLTLDRLDEIVAAGAAAAAVIGAVSRAPDVTAAALVVTAAFAR